MKTPISRPTILRLLSAVLGTVLLPPLGVLAAEHDATHHPDLAEKTREMQERMSRRFHETWKELRNSVESKARANLSVSSATVDVREQNDGYTVRISLPGRDLEKVEVSLVGGNQLRILAPAMEKAGRYEQTLVLDGLASDAKPVVEKRQPDHLIIVRIPKVPAAAEPAPKTAETPQQTLPPPADRWDRDILERMDRMCREMDDMFDQTFERFDQMPEFKDLFDQARFGSSIEVREEDGNYVVNAYLPDRNAENVKVTIDDGNVLKIEAVSEDNTAKEKGAMVLKRKSHYSQLITLPGPVDAAALKVDRKKGLLVITVPKKTQG